VSVLQTGRGAASASTQRFETHRPAPRLFDVAYGVIRRVNAACMAIACVLIGAIALLTVWEAITRYFLRQPATWTYPVSSYLLVYSIYLALAYTLQKGGHVSVDVVVEMASPRVRRWLDRVGHVLGLGFVLVFLVQSVRITSRQMAEGQRDISALAIPIGTISAALPIGLTLLALTYLFVLIDSFMRPPGEATRQELERDRRGAEMDAG
jgi:TRAP-type C4-dicarboxylate transport system permease small subunit